MGISGPDSLVHALNGEEAFLKLSEDVIKNNMEYCSFDLILMDCNMPVMDGYEATEAIRRYVFEVGLPQPIISAVTGHSE